VHGIDHDLSEDEALRMQAIRIELIKRILKAVPNDGHTEPLQGLFLIRHSLPKERSHTLLKPSLCIIAQGSKDIFFGDSCYRYDAFHYLLTALELPTISQVTDASEDRPYLGVRLELPLKLVSSIILEEEEVMPRQAVVRAMDVTPLEPNLLDAVLRLIRLLESPNDTRVLLPLIMREIMYRLLTGEQGVRLRRLALLGGSTPDIVKALQRIRQDFDKPLRIEALAHDLGMSVSGFHHHFKAVTGMSPLQYQKQLRFQEARRLMLVENLDATSAAYRVGYNDASHFIREYKGIFGVPPMRDVQRLRETVASGSE